MNAFSTTGLSKRFRRKWALRDCSLAIPRGRVAALVGPNGAGKTTLLRLAVGLIRPTAGEVTAAGAVAFLSQEKPLYQGFTLAETMRFGRELNPSWDGDLATARIAELGLSPKSKIGALSGGQRAQVALTLVLAKRPELLVLDEPLSNLDPLARHEVMRALMAAVADSGMTVLLSSHVVSDLENTCDWLVVLNRGRVQVSGAVDDLVDEHRLLTGPAAEVDAVAARTEVVDRADAARQSTLLVNGDPGPLSPQWTRRAVGLEDLVLAYLRSPDAAALPRPTLTSA
ncbi:ABC transporter ATP-binding protein [Actinokineospora auranticolor]|uniref:ABC-2 type transport system ATP-binding protein n=1 Tax=Actinokineospora auranticolor TaxID=155976 RepID=A0A2S6GNK5_9PSEU|nr:ABC transporter ATP-binding protein [Actinokineospora auranticolor]PPK66814.1 ABC-2 type transport system ATP-binding protein [Actinokineospora auranticolor]